MICKVRAHVTIIRYKFHSIAGVISQCQCTIHHVCLHTRCVFSDVALSHNNNAVCIYRVSGTRFDLVTTLIEHVQRVTGIDWGAKTNMLVTCSAVSSGFILLLVFDARVWAKWFWTAANSTRSPAIPLPLQIFLPLYEYFPLPSSPYHSVRFDSQSLLPA